MPCQDSFPPEFWSCEQQEALRSDRHGLPLPGAAPQGSRNHFPASSPDFEMETLSRSKPRRAWEWAPGSSCLRARQLGWAFQLRFAPQPGGFCCRCSSCSAAGRVSRPERPAGRWAGESPSGIAMVGKEAGGKKKTNFCFVSFKEKWDPSRRRRCVGGVRLRPEVGLRSVLWACCFSSRPPSCLCSAISSGKSPPSPF